MVSKVLVCCGAFLNRDRFGTLLAIHFCDFATLEHTWVFEGVIVLCSVQALFFYNALYVPKPPFYVSIPVIKVAIGLEIYSLYGIHYFPRCTDAM